MLHFLGHIIESQSSNEEDEFHDSVEDVDGLANIFEETSLKDKDMRLKKADKNLRRINELVEKVTVIPEENVKANPSHVEPCSTSLVGNSVIYVDQLYDKPLSHFDPSLASEIEVGAEYFQTDFEKLPEFLRPIERGNMVRMFLFRR